jgi:hypothetical protein
VCVRVRPEFCWTPSTPWYLGISSCPRRDSVACRTTDNTPRRKSRCQSFCEKTIVDNRLNFEKPPSRTIRKQLVVSSIHPSLLACGASRCYQETPSKLALLLSVLECSDLIDQNCLDTIDSIARSFRLFLCNTANTHTHTRFTFGWSLHTLQLTIYS